MATIGLNYVLLNGQICDATSRPSGRDGVDTTNPDTNSGFSCAELVSPSDESIDDIGAYFHDQDDTITLLLSEGYIINGFDDADVAQFGDTIVIYDYLANEYIIHNADDCK